MRTRLMQYQKNLRNCPKQYNAAEHLLEKQDPDAAVSVEAYVLAPALCSYVAWVIQEAVRSGKKRLYFMARDGYLMYKTAQSICKTLGINLDCRYIYCSRYSLRSAEYRLIGDRRVVDYICLQGIDISFGRMMERAGLTRGQGVEVARSLGINLQDYDLPMKYQTIEQLKGKLLHCELFLNFVRLYSCERYPEVCTYLEREGFTEDVPYAIVDSGWTGSLQKSLGIILKSMGVDRRLEGYYFGLYQIPKDMKTEDYHAWFFSANGNLRRKVYFNNNLFECIYSAPHGMTIAYKDATPVFYEHESANQIKIKQFETLLNQYIRELLSEQPGLEEMNAGKAALAKSLGLFMGTPTKEEAAYFGSYLFCDDVVGGEDIPVARKLNGEELRQNFLWSRLKSRLSGTGSNIKESAWLEGSIALYGDNQGTALLQCRLFLYIRYIRMNLRNKGRRK